MPKKSEIFYLLLILVLILFPAYILQQHWDVLVKSLTVSNDAYTELYFENNEHLPLKITDNKLFNLTYPTLALFTFQFTIHNIENQTTTYPYDVFEVVQGKKTVIDLGTVELKNATKKTISESFSAPKIYPDTEVVVQLPKNNLQISFWIRIKQ